MSEGVSEEEAEAVYNELDRKFGDSKASVPSLMKAIIKTESTTRVGNITQEELGMPLYPLRTTMELEVLTDMIPSMKAFTGYFKKLNEITTAPSLSKNGFLITQATTQRKEFADKTQRVQNKGWFSKKDKPQEQN